MYVPEHFRFEREDDLYDVMRRYSFATLVSTEEGVPFATLAPFVVRRDAAGRVRVWGHIARANPQWRAFGPGVEVLVVFQGPHAYVSPSWYETAPNVPTWNFVVVHAYGVPRLFLDDLETTLWVLAESVAQYEAGFERPWKLDPASEYVRSLLPDVAAFEIELTRVEGQRKLSQNAPEPDRAGAIAGLEGQDDTGAREVARLMREALQGG